MSDMNDLSLHNITYLYFYYNVCKFVAMLSVMIETFNPVFAGS